jgi:exodeoxyribonuclease VII large subunit
MAVPVRADLVQGVMSFERRLLLAVRRLIAERRRHIDGLARGLPKPEDLLAEARQRFDGLARRLPQALRGRASQAEARLNRVAGRVQPGLLTNVVRAHRRALARATERFSRAFARQLREHRLALGRDRARLGTASARLISAGGLAVARVRARLDAATRLMESLSFERTLERGFAVVSDSAGSLLRDGAAALRAGEVEIRFKEDDRVAARIAGPGKSGKKAEKPLPARQGKLL